MTVPTSLESAAAAAGGRRPKRSHVLAWGLWDWGSASFNAVITTFVFTVYLTSDSFGGETTTSAQLGIAMTIAGVLVAVLAPVTGQRSDRGGRRKLWLAVNTYIVVALSALMFFVAPEQGYLWFGLFLLAAGTVFFEFASVNYNAMIAQVSTPKTIGKVSGFGWGMGYVGGIVLLLFVYFGFINPIGGTALFGVPDSEGLPIRVTVLVSAIWFGLFALPVLLAVPEYHAPKAVALEPGQKRPGFFASYGILFRDVRALFRESRETVYFLLASAVFRDGLTGVFTFGGVLAAGSFGFSSGEVIVFAIAANIVAGASTILVGLLDDRFGAKPVMVASLVGLLVCAAFIFALHDGGQTVFWTFGLALCAFVGPAQSASRSFLARRIPEGRDGEIFGLYATTGKAATFLSPALFTLFIGIGAAVVGPGVNVQYWGILGIALVLLVGLLLLIPVRSRGR
ncbi:MFS transporter [Herbiconiux sp. KACC 21604]|uniref:MFS transporter n=1 Tax=unclassified Herbiconiux TaxID=2618217 RepID=UPI0014927EF9|nr:MFS transporter [Herbiconiux sp. SALV-R1]QJU55399.1 MFS transporter [Herbiconiux sp. SALV-R1]WPO86574.1 MFS transporter [Herbiconiux sp. KACC 21604]